MNGPIDLATPLGVTFALLPEVLLTLGAMGVLLVVSWRHRTAADSRLAGRLSLVSLAIAGAGLVYLWRSGVTPLGIPQMVALDTFRYASGGVFLLAAAGTILLAMPYLEREGMLAPEFFCLILLATAGMMFMAGAQDLIVIFLGLEVMSVAVYVLAGYDRASAFSAEAALKYFLIGAFASGFLLYGIALIYGSTGSTNLIIIGAQLSGGTPPQMASLGLGLLLIGFGFKMAAVPFHMWAPDVYDGAPTPVTGFMATGVKAAAFLALARVLVESFPTAITRWQPIVQALAVLTMVLGNLVALAQPTVKRMLAYSSVAHAGYLLVALWPGTLLGTSALLFYLLAYTLTTLASFGILGVLGRGGEREVKVDDLAGLAEARPWLAFGFSVCLLSLLGFPGTIGFIGKWYILSAVIQQHRPFLAVVLVVTSLISAGYYLPLIMAMYMKRSRVPLAHSGLTLARTAGWTIALAVAAILLLGVMPGGALSTADGGAAGLVETTRSDVASP